MRRKRKRIGAIGVLLVVAIGAAVGALHADPELARIETAVMGYVGDLRLWRLKSAAKRVDPQYLLLLKRAAIRRAGESPFFREELYEYFGLSDASDALSVPKERYFEFLVERVRRLHPEVVRALVQGRIVGMEVRRSGDAAFVQVTMELSDGGKRRWFVLRVGLVRRGGAWYIVL